jgi:hypothetical protein
MANTEYTVIEGERWDTISQKAYGKAGAFSGIIAANPLVPITTRLAGGIVLQIPIIEDNSLLTDLENLPPWKR